MSEKKESQRKTQTKMQLEIVNFLDIDTNKITFKEPKSNKYNGSQIACYTMEGQCLSNMKELLLLV